MINHLLGLQILLRRITFFLLPPFLIVISLSILAAQFTEFATKSEILSLSSFVVLLSFSALAFNWCRVSPALTSEKILKLVYQSGIDLFLASLLALIASFFSWLKTNPSFLSLYPGLFVLHWLFLTLAIFLFLIAILAIIKAAKDINATEQSPAGTPRVASSEDSTSTGRSL
jgi:hypothetical protein